VAASRRGGDRARRVVRSGVVGREPADNIEYAVQNKDAEGLAEISIRTHSISGRSAARIGTCTYASVNASPRALSPFSSPLAFPDQSKFTSKSSSFGAYFFCSFFHSFRSLPLYFRSSSGISPTFDGLFSS